MAEAQMRADMEALMARLIQTEQALLDMRLQISAAPKEAPLVDTRTIGKAPTFFFVTKTGQSVSFQFLAHMRSANPKSIEAIRWAATAVNPIGVAAVRTQGLRGSQSSAVLCPGTVVQRKRPNE